MIHRDLATTGDGVLTAVQLFDAACRRPDDLATWAAGVMTRFPQVLQNVRMAEKLPDLAEQLAAAVEAEEAILGDSGRVLIRESGTEPVVRVMVEAEQIDLAEGAANRLVQAVSDLGR